MRFANKRIHFGGPDPNAQYIGKVQVGLTGVTQNLNSYYTQLNLWRQTSLILINTNGAAPNNVKRLSIAPGLANSAWFDTITGQAYVDADGELINPTPADVTSISKLWAGGTSGIRTGVQLTDVYDDQGTWYVLTWDGDQNCTVTTGLTNVSTTTPGGKKRIEGQIPAPVAQFTAVTLTLSVSNFDHNNPPKNFKLFRKDYESNLLAGEFFSPDYVDMLKVSSGVIRNMDWTMTNSNIATKKWTDFPGDNFIDYSSMGGDKHQAGTVKVGVPATRFTELANEVHSHPWYSFAQAYGFPYAQLAGVERAVTSQQTNGIPINVSFPSHGMQVGSPFWYTTGAPTGLSNSVVYFVASVVDADNIQISLTQGGAAVNATTTANVAGVIRTVFGLNSTTGAPVLWVWNHGIPNGHEVTLWQKSGTFWQNIVTGISYSATNGQPITFNKTAHKIPNGYAITSLGGTRPQGVTTAPYWVVNATADTFQISVTRNGSAVVATQTASASNVTATLMVPRNTYTVINATQHSLELQTLSGETLDTRGWSFPGTGGGFKICSAFNASTMANIATEVGLYAAYVRDNLADGLIARFEFGNEHWNFATAFDGFDMQSAIGRYLFGADNNEKAYGYMAAHYMRCVYDTFGAGNRSRWLGMWGVQTTFVALNSTTLQGVQAYVADNPGYTLNMLFDAIACTGYWGGSLYTQSGQAQVQNCTFTNSAVTGQPTVVSNAGGFVYKLGYPLVFSNATSGLPPEIVAGELYFVANLINPNLVGEATQYNIAKGTAPGVGYLTDKRADSPLISTSSTGTGTHQVKWSQEKWTRNVVANSDDRFINGLEATRYAYFDRVYNAEEYDNSYTGIPVSLKINVETNWPQQKAFADGQGLQLHQYEGGHGADLLDAGAPLAGSFSATYTGSITADELNVTQANNGTSTIKEGDTVWGVDVLPGTRVLAYGTGGTTGVGSTGTYKVTRSQTIAAGTLMQNAMRAFLPAGLHTAADAANYQAAFQGFLDAGGQFPAKFVDLGPMVTTSAFGGLRYRGDSNPVWDEVVAFNDKTPPP